MPTAEQTRIAVTRRDDALVFDGVLTRPVVASAWRQAQALIADAQVLDVSTVARIDSAGLAMLAALARSTGIARINGTPAGYTELRAAYRMDASLACTAG